MNALRIAVIGAGPVGLSLALHAARALPGASISLFDSRLIGVDAARDPRTIALSLGSIQLLERLKAWHADAAQPITRVHISQQGPTQQSPDPCVQIDAADQRVAQLGAVLRYGAIVAPLEAVWLAAAAREPNRLMTRFGTAVAELKNRPSREARGVLLRCEGAPELEEFDIAVVAEGGVFADQARKSVRHDYRQTAWVGKVTLQGGLPGVAFERFTRHGPAALLPLPPSTLRTGIPVARSLTPSLAQSLMQSDTQAIERPAALVWCVSSDHDPVRELDDAQRVALLNSIFHRDTGRVTSIGPLKHFALGLNAERTLTDGRIVRIGNAAQTLHPVAGQGLNLGMRDSFELVMRLSAALRSGTDAASTGSSSIAVDEALRRIEWSRAPDRWAMIAATDFLARSFTWHLPGLTAVRGAALAGLQIASPLKSFIARQMMFGRR
ncbi:UbiH/UbiF/VisC/COQ6 family ubiquinone biosynthesis hydroxylase [soil metagenome]